MDDTELLLYPEVREVLHGRDANDQPRPKYQRASRLIPRRLRTFFNFFSVPPRSANRRALSRAISASNPCLTSDVFSTIPESREAFFRRSSSMFNVVRICTNMHYLCI